MSCCSNRRVQATPFSALRAAAARTPPAAIPTGLQSTLRYTGSTELALRGPVTGQVYRVGPRRRTIDAHPGDAAALLRTGLFIGG